jgi:hypothetical protein
VKKVDRIIEKLRGLRVSEATEQKRISKNEADYIRRFFYKLKIRLQKKIGG